MYITIYKYANIQIHTYEYIYTHNYIGKDLENSNNNSNIKPIEARADLKELFSLGPSNPDAGWCI